ncbi:COMM domain-containing protein 7 isoform X2 [Rhinatrema bivittatum]|uniref:COMM domain-containing protein 7 isoform X2 n=1 Tax=Rhinatrema bivittatum TaxID=194408 RepID=UPI00112A3A9B|nr:COMM domain-containing protein 7 isoform X2 [Rhinatrema bivittatum]
MNDCKRGRGRSEREGGRGGERKTQSARAASGTPDCSWTEGQTEMGYLNFTQEPVPDSVTSDMQNLNQLVPEFSALAEVIFHYLTDPKEVDQLFAKLSEFGAVNGISLGALKNIIKSTLLVTNGALKRNLTAEELRADWIALGLSEEKASQFADQWQKYAPALTRLALGQILEINQLVDMEWKFAVTAGSSELNKVGSIFLQLKLVIKKGSNIENVYIELSLPQFYSFLHEMERVKSDLDCFS